MPRRVHESKRLGPESPRMSIPELAEILEISQPMAYRVAEEGRFGSFKVGSTYFVSRRSVMNWVEGKPETATVPHVNPLIRRFELSPAEDAA